jgi:predicted ATPase
MRPRSARRGRAASGVDPQIRLETPDLRGVRCQTCQVAVSSESPDSVFVGRERELGGIRSLLDRATGGEAQALLVSGDAGVGKTALVARACSDREGSFIPLIGVCLPLTSMSIPFLPIRSALRGLSGVVAPPDVANAEGEERDFTLTFDAWLDRQCDLDPVVLIVDDMQWADRSTLDALMYVMAGPAHRRLAVIATLRSGEVGVGHPLQRWLADIRRLPRTAELALGPLDRAGTGEQIQALLATSPHQSLIDDVHRRSRGNPYFTRLMVAGLPPEARAAPAAFPADLSSAVLQSWYRLAAPTRHLATVLAVGGRAMRADEVAEVVGAETGVETGMDTRSCLLEAVDAGTLDLRGDGAFWFHHPMNAEVLEAALGDDERLEWHRRFADLYEARLDGRALPVETAVAIADHRHRAGDVRSAYEWALTAADAAGAAAGWAEQLRLLRRAVALRSRLPDADESFDGLLQRVRAAAADAGATGDELEAVEALLARIHPDVEPLAASELMVRRMHLRFMTGQAFIEVDEMNEAERLAATDPSSPQHALALAELAHAELWNELPIAAEHAREAVAVARGAGDPKALSHALTASSMAALIAEDGTTAMRLAREAVTLAIAARDWWAFVHATLW